jgi:tetratricopeptide (TPR) repeat protein
MREACQGNNTSVPLQYLVLLGLIVGTALAACTTTPPEIASTDPTTLREESWELQKAGNDRAAIKLAERAVEIAEQDATNNPLVLAECLENLARRKERADQGWNGVNLYRRALLLRRKAPEQTELDLVRHLNQLAMRETWAHNTPGAFAMYKESVTILESNLGPESPELEEPLHRLGNLYQIWNESARAEAYHLRAIDIVVKAHGADHLLTARSLNHLITHYQNAGQVEQEKQAILRQLAIRETATLTPPQDLSNSLTRLAKLYTRQGEYAKAEPLYQRAINLFQEPGGWWKELQSNQLDLAELYLRARQPTKAARWTMEALITETLYGNT